MTTTNAFAPLHASNPFYACLMAAKRDEVLGLAEQLAEGWQLSPLQASGISENGLALLQWQDSVMHQRFFLGEIPISSAALAMTDSHGKSYEGGAIIMKEDSQLVQAIAVMDIVWRHQLPGFEQIAKLVATGALVRSQNDSVRKQILARTRVDFSLLSSTEESPLSQDSGRK